MSTKTTKSWFKRDIITLNNAIIYSLRKSPLIFLSALLFSLVINYYYQAINFENIIKLTFSLFLIIFLGYFMILTMMRKGYSIDTP